MGSAVEVFEDGVIIDQPVRFSLVHDGREEVEPEPGNVGDGKVTSEGEEVGGDHQDVEDVLHDGDSVGWRWVQGQDGDEKGGHANDGQVAEDLDEQDDVAKN